MSKTKAGGSTANVRDSQGQRLGVKIFGGQKARAGQVLIRHRGTKFVPGDNVSRGNDDTLYAAASGVVSFSRKKIKGFTGLFKRKTVINVLPE